MIFTKWSEDCDRFERLRLKDAADFSDNDFDFFETHPRECTSGAHKEEVLNHVARLTSREIYENLFGEPLPRFESVRDISDEFFLHKSPAMAPPVRPDLSSRRSFIVGITSLGLAALLPDVVEPPAEETWLSAGLVPKYEELLERSQRGGSRTRRRWEMLAHLLKPEGDIVYSVPTSHPEIPMQQLHPDLQTFGLPHDRAAIAAFRTLDPKSPISRPTDGEELTILPKQHLVVGGSPVSNDEAKLYLPYRKANQSTLISENYRPERLPYHFVIGTEETMYVRSAALGGKERPAHDQCLELTASGKLWAPRHYVDDKDYLKTDFLLVSRLPRTRDGGEVVIIAGAHGPGVEAFELLFDEDAFPDFSELWKKLEGRQYFQFVLECPVSNDGKVSKATSLSICQDCPPEIIKEPYDELFHASKGA